VKNSDGNHSTANVNRVPPPSLEEMLEKNKKKQEAIAKVNIDMKDSRCCPTLMIDDEFVAF
jgi:hypothetical protein